MSLKGSVDTDEAKQIATRDPDGMSERQSVTVDIGGNSDNTVVVVGDHNAVSFRRGPAGFPDASRNVHHTRRACDNPDRIIFFPIFGTDGNDNDCRFLPRQSGSSDIVVQPRCWGNALENYRDHVKEYHDAHSNRRRTAIRELHVFELGGSWIGYVDWDDVEDLTSAIATRGGEHFNYWDLNDCYSGEKLIAVPWYVDVRGFLLRTAADSQLASMSHDQLHANWCSIRQRGVISPSGSSNLVGQHLHEILDGMHIAKATQGMLRADRRLSTVGADEWIQAIESHTKDCIENNIRLDDELEPNEQNWLAGSNDYLSIYLSIQRIREVHSKSSEKDVRKALEPFRIIPVLSNTRQRVHRVHPFRGGSILVLLRNPDVSPQAGIELIRTLVTSEEMVCGNSIEDSGYLTRTLRPPASAKLRRKWSAQLKGLEDYVAVVEATVDAGRSPGEPVVALKSDDESMRYTMARILFSFPGIMNSPFRESFRNWLNDLLIRSQHPARIDVALPPFYDFFVDQSAKTGHRQISEDTWDTILNKDEIHSSNKVEALRRYVKYVLGLGAEHATALLLAMFPEADTLRGSHDVIEPFRRWTRYENY